MTTSPPKVERGKDSKKNRNAFKTFAVSSTGRPNLAEMDEPVIPQKQSTHCGVCKMPFFAQTKRKECKFCRTFVCMDHLRKKRFRNGQFKRICDDCEDKALFQNYMKIEIKAEEAMVAHEEIVKLREEESRIQLDARYVKMSLMNAQKEHLAKQYADSSSKHNYANIDLSNKMGLLQKEMQSNQQQHIQLDIVQVTLPRALQDDFQALKIEDGKITKQLLKLEKRSNQLVQLMSKAQQEVTKAYEVWENKQKVVPKKKEDCLLF